MQSNVSEKNWQIYGMLLPIWKDKEFLTCLSSLPTVDHMPEPWATELCLSSHHGNPGRKESFQCLMPFVPSICINTYSLYHKELERTNLPPKFKNSPTQHRLYPWHKTHIFISLAVAETTIVTVPVYECTHHSNTWGAYHILPLLLLKESLFF